MRISSLCRPCGTGVTEYMWVYSADGFVGEPIPCDEGELEWVEKDRIEELEIWEGDKIFLRLMAADAPVFSLKLVYDGQDNLIEVKLDGRELPEDPVQ